MPATRPVPADRVLDSGGWARRVEAARQRRSAWAVQTLGVGCAAGLVLLFAPGTAPAVATPSSAPDLRMLADAPPRVVRPSRDGRVPLSVQLFVSAQDAPLQLRARREGPRIEVDQVVGPAQEGTRRATRLRSRGFPSGVADFVELVVRDRRGRVVGRQQRDVCPNGFPLHLDPVKPDSPERPTSGFGCGPALAHEMAWGLDVGWAIPVMLHARLRLRPGRYRATATVDPQRRLEDADRTNNLASFSFQVRSRSTREASAARAAPVPPGIAAADLPDLRALPAHNLTIQRRRGTERLRFDGVIWNAGLAPLIVEGESAGPRRMAAFQRLGGDAGGARPRIGRLGFEEHGHWHFERLARYRLLDRRQRPVRGATGPKVGWCFLGTDPIDHGIPGSPLDITRLERGTECGSPISASVRLTIPVGWGDRYPAEFPGQYIEVSRIPAGTYYVEITADPDHRVVEVTADNNRALRRVVLRRGPRGRPRLVVPPYRGIDVEREEAGGETGPSFDPAGLR